VTADISRAANRLYVVTIRIEYECRVVAWWITFGGVAKPRCPIVYPARLQGGRVESIDLGAALGCERRMLLHAVWVKAVDPENRVIDSIANAVGTVVLRKLHNPAKAERAQGSIVEGGGTGDVGDTDARMIDRCGILRLANGPVFELVIAGAAACGASAAVLNQKVKQRDRVQVYRD
jgi:hypothetical protein